MWILVQGEGWHECSHRNPRPLLIEAGPEYRAACIRVGGLNRFARPNYRLVWMPSRLEMTGDFEVKRQDENGNVLSLGTETVCIAKYPVSEAHDCYVLEFWRPPEWYIERGRPHRELLWNVAKSVRQLPPVPDLGDYEAVEFSPANPVRLFNRYTVLAGKLFDPMTITLVELAIRQHLATVNKPWAVRLAEEKAAQKVTDRCLDAAYDDQIREALGPYALRPHSGYGGKTREIGSQATRA